MKLLVFVTAASLAASTSLAVAGEGNGNPFPYQATGVTTVTGKQPKLPSGPANPFPYRANPTVETTSMSQALLPAVGGEGSTVEPINSLPPGFADGATQYRSVRMRDAYVAKEMAHDALVARASRGNAASNS